MSASRKLLQMAVSLKVWVLVLASFGLHLGHLDGAEWSMVAVVVLGIRGVQYAKTASLPRTTFSCGDEYQAALHRGDYPDPEE